MRILPMRIVLILALFSLSFIAFADDAFALRVSMKRIIFDGKKRSEIITIINNTGEEQTYRLGWKKYIMSEGNQLHALKDDDEKEKAVLWADGMIRFAPRRVTVPAGGSQQVRLFLRRPADIQEAEYRAHLWIVTETKPEKFKQDDSDKQSSVRVKVQPAISLPVFVRHGNLDLSMELGDLALKRVEEGLDVSFTLHREGGKSSYGDFEFICTDSDVVLKQIRGVAVYTEVAKRFFNYRIPLTEETTPSCNSMDIVYKADPSGNTEKTAAILARASASVQ